MFEELLAYLEENGVRFVVVGGIAVVIHGFARLTADIDLVIDLEKNNVLRCVEALGKRGLHPMLPVAAADFANEEIRNDWIENRNLQVFSMRDARNPLLTVDLFARTPIPFEELWNDAETFSLGGHPIRIASLDHLIRMKRAAARPQDLLDLEHLERIARSRHA
jgi:predicted nucleotidyltransferase